MSYGAVDENVPDANEQHPTIEVHSFRKTSRNERRCDDGEHKLKHAENRQRNCW